jgi:hypothetical protein
MILYYPRGIHSQFLCRFREEYFILGIMLKLGQNSISTLQITLQNFTNTNQEIWVWPSIYLLAKPVMQNDRWGIIMVSVENGEPNS